MQATRKPPLSANFECFTPDPASFSRRRSGNSDPWRLRHRGRGCQACGLLLGFLSPSAARYCYQAGWLSTAGCGMKLLSAVLREQGKQGPQKAAAEQAPRRGEGLQQPRAKEASLMPGSALVALPWPHCRLDPMFLFRLPECPLPQQPQQHCSPGLSCSRNAAK